MSKNKEKSQIQSIILTTLKDIAGTSLREQQYYLNDLKDFLTDKEIEQNINLFFERLIVHQLLVVIGNNPCVEK